MHRPRPLPVLRVADRRAVPGGVAPRHVRRHAHLEPVRMRPAPGAPQRHARGAREPDRPWLTGEPRVVLDDQLVPLVPGVDAGGIGALDGPVGVPDERAVAVVEVASAVEAAHDAFRDPSEDASATAFSSFARLIEERPLMSSSRAIFARSALLSSDRSGEPFRFFCASFCELFCEPFWDFPPPLASATLRSSAAIRSDIAVGSGGSASVTTSRPLRLSSLSFSTRSV